MSAARTLALGIAALMLCGCAPSPQGIEGRYLLRVEARDDPPWRGMLGNWIADFRADGRLDVRQVGGVSVEARYRVRGDLLMIDDFHGDGACRENGADLASALYRIRFVDGNLIMQPLRDECRGRRESLPIRAWQRLR